ncbi:MAG: GntR family transcriptional regulator, partial [Caldilineaceae bacterium]
VWMTALSRQTGARAMKRESARRVDEVGRSLEEEILSGALRPGDRLLVIPLAQRFDVSQSTIREALLTLERHGLAQTRPRRGTFVTRLSEAEAVELCRMRALLEAYAVTVGAPRLTAGLLDALTQHVREMQQCDLPRSLPRLIQIDLAFHRRIAELADAPTLMEVWSNLSGRIGALIIRSMEANQLRIDDVIRLHTEVIDALATGDAPTCRLAIINHYVPEVTAEPHALAQIDASVQALVLS